MTFIYELIVIILMLGCTAVCVAYEMGLASISRSRIAVLVGQKKRGAAEAEYMKGRMEASLAIAQLGITLAAAIAAATGGAGIVEEFAPYLHAHWGLSAVIAKIIALVVLIIPFTFVTIVFAELVPKVYALHNRDRVVLKLSPAMKLVGRLTYPAIRLMETVVKRVVGLVSGGRGAAGADRAREYGLHELLAAASLARTSKLLSDREEKIVAAAAGLSSRRVRDVMLPASEIYMIDAGSSLTDALLKAHLDMHTRFPVCAKEGDPQTISGYLNFKDIVVALKGSPADMTINGITRPISRVDEQSSLSQVLEKMMREKTHIVIVASAAGRVLGMVTLEDIIEQLVGEIEDEFDRASTRVQRYGESWIMGAGVAMTTVAATLGLDWSGRFPQGRVPTLIDWCAAVAGRPPGRGEVIERDGLRVLPRKFRRKRMSEAIVSLAPVAAPKP